MIPHFSVIIPVFHESALINDTIEHVLAVAAGAAVEIIVVDGEPSGGTIRQIRNCLVKKALSEKGRGNQLNRGVFLAKGEILLFLHADARLPAGAFSKIAAAMSSRKIIGGAFRLTIDSGRSIFRAIEKGFIIDPAIWDFLR